MYNNMSFILQYLCIWNYNCYYTDNSDHRRCRLRRLDATRRSDKINSQIFLKSLLQVLLCSRLIIFLSYNAIFIYSLFLKNVVVVCNVYWGNVSMRCIIFALHTQQRLHRREHSVHTARWRHGMKHTDFSLSKQTLHSETCWVSGSAGGAEGLTLSRGGIKSAASISFSATSSLPNCSLTE